jgi:hypothetical protein
MAPTLDSGIDVGQGINIGPGKFGKKNNHRDYISILKYCTKMHFSPFE